MPTGGNPVVSIQSRSSSAHNRRPPCGLQSNLDHQVRNNKKPSCGSISHRPSSQIHGGPLHPNSTQTRHSNITSQLGDRRRAGAAARRWRWRDELGEARRLLDRKQKGLWWRDELEEELAVTQTQLQGRRKGKKERKRKERKKKKKKKEEEKKRRRGGGDEVDAGEERKKKKKRNKVCPTSR
ncbi:hypothetical protein JCGZ_24205 [Jatropha curcas]|uniref:Uncharacterized protein n=1 Tax=Jatropha curcas TaxID=180498 RepID=A0A067LGK3_JATCU|nr:hypothetical protein JCGZ_24205 [Jatropha curcas]